MEQARTGRQLRGPGPGPRRGEGGQASVEFALVLPLLVLMLVGMLQAVVLGTQAARVASAAREAARAAAVGRDEQGVREAAARGGGGLDPERLTVSISPQPAVSGQPVTVMVTYPTELFVPAAGRLGVVPPAFTSAATMLAE